MADADKHSYMRENDPYRGMEGAITRPDYIARRKLSEAEKAASKKRTSERSNTVSPNSTRFNRGGVSILKTGEEEQNSSYLNRVQGRNDRVLARNAKIGTQLAGKKKKGKVKQFAPLAFICGILCGGAALIFGATSSLIPTLVSLVTKATDRQYTTSSLRSPRIFKYMLDGGNQLKVSGFTMKYTTFSPRLKNRLAKYGIEVGYIDASGAFKTDQLIANSSTVLRYEGKIVDASSFQTEFATNTKFRDAYSKAKRGRVAGFFDHSADNFFTERGTTRDVLNDYKSTGDQEADTENFRSKISENVTGVDGTINSVRTETDQESGEERHVKNGEDVSTKNTGSDTAEIKARNVVNQIASKVTNDGVIVCSVMRIANIAAIVISAIQIYQSARFFQDMMEPESKAMYGSGAASGVNVALNYFTRPEPSTITYVDENGQTKEETTNKSPLQSNGAKIMLGNTRVSPEDVIPYTATNITRAAKRIVIATGATQTVCSGVMAASAIVSLTSNAVPGGTLANFVIGFAAQTVGGIVITGVVAALVSTIIPKLTEYFAEQLFESNRIKGQSGGEYVFMGAAVENGDLARQGSAYMPGSEETLLAYNHNTAIALADEAELDRYNRSPFDTSSENTFLGSIVSKFSYISYSDGLVGGISEAAGIVSSSVKSILPSTYAAGEQNLYSAQYQECSNLPGAMCDVYDNPIYVSDMSTIDISPDDPTYTSVINQNLDYAGEIRDGSELSKFVNFCVNRESPWGVTDANILNALQTDNGIILNNIPYLNDLTDIVNAVEDVENQKWATGEVCLASSSNPRWDSEFKYYQRYIEDMRIIDTLSDEDNENPVLAYRNRYIEDHPLDNTQDGIIARISGITTNDVAFLREYTRYTNWLAQYDPTERYAFGVEKNETVESTDDQENFEFSPVMATLQKSANLFFDKRNYLV